jgi:hypothetical protein
MLRNMPGATPEGISVEVWLVRVPSEYDDRIQQCANTDADILVADLGLADPGGGTYSAAVKIARDEFPISKEWSRIGCDCQSPDKCPLRIGEKEQKVCLRREPGLAGLTFVLRFARCAKGGRRGVVMVTGVASKAGTSFGKSVCDQFGVRATSYSALSATQTRQFVCDWIKEFITCTDPFEETCQSIGDLMKLLEGQFQSKDTRPFPHLLGDDQSGAAQKAFREWALRHFPDIDLGSNPLVEGAYEAVKGFGDARYPVYLGTLGLLALFLRGRNRPDAGQSGRTSPLGISLTTGELPLTRGMAQPKEPKWKRGLLEQIELLWKALGGEHLERLRDVKLENDAFRAVFDLTDGFDGLMNGYKEAVPELGSWLRDGDTMELACPLRAGANTTRSLIAVQLMSGLQVCFRDSTDHSRPATGSINLIGQLRELVFEIRP